MAWRFDEHYQATWEELRRLITCAPVLRYYDQDKELMIQCDASQSGLDSPAAEGSSSTCALTTE